MIQLESDFQIDDTFFVSDAAASRITTLLKLEKREGQSLMITVAPGGCSGYTYDFDWADEKEHGVIFTNGEAKVLIKPMELRHVGGSTLNFTDSLKGSFFELDNPNATDICSCGKSFA